MQPPTLTVQKKPMSNRVNEKKNWFGLFYNFGGIAVRFVFYCGLFQYFNFLSLSVGFFGKDIPRKIFWLSALNLKEMPYIYRRFSRNLG